MEWPREHDYFAYNVVSVSAAELARIRERLLVAFRDIRSLVAASKLEEVAALINLQIFTFESPSSVGEAPVNGSVNDPLSNPAT